MMLRSVSTLTLLTLCTLVLACEAGDGRADTDASTGIDVPDPADPEPVDPGEYLEGIDGEFQRAADEFDVPVDLLKAVGYVESKWEMVEGQVEFDDLPPAFGTMALRGDNVGRAAALLGVDVDAVKTDRETNIRGAAALLSATADERAIDRDDLGAWAPAVAELAAIGHESAAITYIHDHVYGLIRNGLVVTDSDGKVISEIEATPDVAPDYAPPGSGPVLNSNPDYAGAIFRSSPNYSSRPAGDTGKIRMVIIHSCEGAYAGCWGWLVNKSSGVSAHYVVKEDGSEISQLVKESNKAWHIGATYDCDLNGKKECHLEGYNANNFTVGIEHAGFASQSSWNSNLINQSAKLSCDITKGHGIPRDKYHIVGHGQLQPYNRTDPGKNWPWTTYLNKINEHCGAPAPQPDPQPGGTLIVDSNNANNDPAKAKITVSANWTSSASTPGYYGSGYWFASTSPISDGAEFAFYLPADATKTIDAWWTAGTNRSPEAPFVIFDSAGNKVATVKVNQQQNGKKWVQIGTFKFKKGWNKVVLSRWAPQGYVVIADAIRVR